MQTPILQSERSTTARDPLNENWVVRVGAAGETLFVDELAYPTTPTVGDPIDIRVQVVNAALNIGPSDGDYCTERGVTPGYEYEITVDIEGVGTQTRRKCLERLLETDHNFDFQAPQTPGTYTMEVTVEGVGTGFSGGGTREIEVVAEGGDNDRGNDDNRQEEGGGDDDNTAGDDDGDGLPDLGNLIGTTDALVIGGGLVLFLVVLISLQQ